MDSLNKIKVLIVCYYYPPCTLTAANRVLSWAKYFNQFGIYPIIVTRHWDADVNSINYINKQNLQPLSIEKNEQFELHKVPHYGNYRTNRLGLKLNLLQKVIYNFSALKESLFRYFFSSALPYYSIIEYAEKMAIENKPDILLITGNPFYLYKLGYDLHKKIHLPWIADYRDGWTTEAYKENKGILTNLFFGLDKIFEKKWLKTAAFFTTVSESLKNNIEEFIGLKGHVVYNGFFKEDVLPITTNNKNEIHFLYSGSIYPKQDYKTFVKIFKKVTEQFANKITFKLTFLGTSYLNNAFASDEIFANTSKYISLPARVDYNTSLQYHAQADVFLMFTHKGMKGQASSKIFDYIKYQKHILLYNNDKDVLENILTQSTLGIITDSELEIENALIKLIEEKLSSGKINTTPNIDYIDSFSREKQAEKLAAIIKKKIKKGSET